MFTTNLILLMPVVGVAAGLVAAMLVVKAQDARLSAVGFGARGSRVLVPLYTKEGVMIALAMPLAVLLFGSCAVMLKEYYRAPAPAPTFTQGHPVFPTDLGIGGSITEIVDKPHTELLRKTPTGLGVPKPVPDQIAPDEASLTQRERGEAGAGTIDPDKLKQDSLVLRDGGIPDKGYVALDKYPELVKRVDPVYPSIALTVGSQGRVCLQALLDVDGSVMRVEISQSSGNPALDEAALGAVKQWVFTPAIAPDGKPTRVWQMCPINFKLAR